MIRYTCSPEVFPVVEAALTASGHHSRCGVGYREVMEVTDATTH
jgi:hypothetical protein